MPFSVGSQISGFKQGIENRSYKQAIYDTPSEGCPLPQLALNDEKLQKPRTVDKERDGHWWIDGYRNWDNEQL